MEPIKGHDKWLDPPDGPSWWACDKCGVIYDGGDLNYIKKDDLWLCDEDYEEYKRLEAEDIE